MANSGITCVSFDAGNTLLYCNPPPERIYADQLGRFGRSVTAAEVGPVFADAWRTMQNRTRNGLDRYSSFPGGERAWWSAFLSDVLDRLEHDAPMEPLLDALYAEFARPDVWWTYPESLGVLDRLRELGYRTAIVSNWDRRLPEILDRLEITPRVDTVLVSALEGVEKPSPEFFTRALSRLGAEAESTLHVGDSPREDYYGATNAGLSALLIDRNHNFVDDPMQTVSSLTRVLTHLGENPLIERSATG